MIADMARVLGLLLLVSAFVLLIFGYTALDCLVIAVVGCGLSLVGTS